jgi:hypothetical protein
LASANIVGYNTVTLKKGWNMLCVNFQGIADEGLDIQTLFLGTTEGFTAGGISAADQIQIYNQATADYTIYYLFDTPLTIPALARLSTFE